METENLTLGKSPQHPYNAVMQPFILPKKFRRPVHLLAMALFAIGAVNTIMGSFIYLAPTSHALMRTGADIWMGLIVSIDSVTNDLSTSEISVLFQNRLMQHSIDDAIERYQSLTYCTLSTLITFYKLN